MGASVVPALGQGQQKTPGTNGGIPQSAEQGIRQQRWPSPTRLSTIGGWKSEVLTRWSVYRPPELKNTASHFEKKNSERTARDKKQSTLHTKNVSKN